MAPRREFAVSAMRFDPLKGLGGSIPALTHAPGRIAVRLWVLVFEPAVRSRFTHTAPIA
jgi:hypothetical protein